MRVERLVCRGNVLAEYGLVIALVGIAGIAALVLFSSNVRSALDFMIGNTKPSAPVMTASAGSPSNGSAGANSGGLVQNGSMLEFSNISGNLMQNIETNGANGATLLASDSLLALAKQLQASGQITPEDYSMMVDLANQGHHLASIEKALEDTASASSTANAYKGSQLMVDGQLYSTQQLADMIGWNNQATSNNLNPFLLKDANPETAKFIKLYQDVQQIGALKDPAVQAQVQTLSSQISGLTEVTAEAAYQVSNAGEKPSIFKEKVVSEASSYNSTTLCKIAKHSDTSKKCS